MKDNLVIDAVEETGLPAKNIAEIQENVKERNYCRAEALLRKGRQSLLEEIHQKEDEIRHIDWIIYTLGKAE